MPHLINMPRAAWRQQPSAGTDLADPGRWSTAACLNTPIYNSSGVNGIGWSTGGASGSAFLSGSDPTEMTQKADGVVIQNVADYLTGAEIKIAGITNGSEVVGSFVFAFKSATVVNSYIMLVADRSYNYVRYDGGTTLRVFFNNRATEFTIPSLLDGRDHVLAIRLSKSTYLNRATFLDGRMIGAQDQADTVVNGWDSTDSSLPPRIFGWQSYYNRDWNATNQFFAYTTNYLSDDELIALTENPWQLFNPRPAQFILIPNAGGSGLFITPADLEHAQTIDAGILTQAHLLAANGLSHNQSVSDATLSMSGTLSPAGLEHDQVIDASALVQDHQLTPDGLQHINTLGEAALIQAHSLIPAGLDHVHTLDATILAQAHVITPATLTHTHSVAVATLELSGTLSPDGLTHQQALDFATLVQAHVITPAGLEHGHELTLAELSQATILIADNLAHLQTLASPALSVGLSITPGGLVHVQSLDDATLTQAYILIPSDLAHVQTLSAAQISTGNIYVPAGRVIVIGASDRYLVIMPSDRTILLS